MYYTVRSVLLGGSGGMPPQEIFFILGLLRLFLVQFRDKIAIVIGILAGGVILFINMRGGYSLPNPLLLTPVTQPSKSHVIITEVGYAEDFYKV